VVVDITTTGATLEANHLKRLDDGLILRSQAQLAASLRAAWSAEALAAARRLLGVLEARARAKATLTLVWPADQDERAREALAAFGENADWRSSGLLVPASSLFAATAALADAGVGPVTVTRPEYVFAPASEAADNLAGSPALLTAIRRPTLRSTAFPSIIAGERPTARPAARQGSPEADAIRRGDIELVARLDVEGRVPGVHVPHRRLRPVHPGECGPVTSCARSASSRNLVRHTWAQPRKTRWSPVIPSSTGRGLASQRQAVGLQTQGHAARGRRCSRPSTAGR
jgi:hypothetical protein